MEDMAMNKFRRICIVDKTGLNEQAIERLRGLSDALDCYDDYPTDQEEIARRIGDADLSLIHISEPTRRS